MSQLSTECVNAEIADPVAPDVAGAPEIAFFRDDTAVYPAAFYGAVRAGFVPVLLNIQTKPDVLNYFLADSGARFAIVEAELARELGPETLPAPAQGLRHRDRRGRGLRELHPGRGDRRQGHAARSESHPQARPLGPAAPARRTQGPDRLQRRDDLPCGREGGASPRHRRSTCSHRTDTAETTTPTSRFGRFVNLIDYCSVALPSGLSADKLPTSIQFIARRNEEAIALRIAAGFEALRGPFPHPPGLD